MACRVSRRRSLDDCQWSKAEGRLSYSWAPTMVAPRSKFREVVVEEQWSWENNEQCVAMLGRSRVELTRQAGRMERLAGTRSTEYQGED